MYIFFKNVFDNLTKICVFFHNVSVLLHFVNTNFMMCVAIHSTQRDSPFFFPGAEASWMEGQIQHVPSAENQFCLGPEWEAKRSVGSNPREMQS